MPSIAKAPCAAEPVARGPALRDWIQQDLPRLKPKMRGVAEQLLHQAATLHQQGIEDLAQQTRTAPATIVRLAKRYGFVGFSDLKMAFLPPPADNPPRAALIARIHQDLPRLSPQMRKVGEKLIGHSSNLHLQRLKPLAQQVGTTPITIVRLAKRYGFVGFHDLKLAFLPTATGPQAATPDADKKRLQRR